MRNRIARRIGTTISALALIAGVTLAGATTATADAYGGNVYNSQYSDAHVVYKDRYTGRNANLYPAGYAGEDRVVAFRIPSGHHATLYYANRYIGCLPGGTVYYPRGVYMHVIDVQDWTANCY